MALSGNFNTTGYDGGGAPYYLRFSWTAEQSIANNTSTVSWTVTVKGGSGYNTISKRHVKVGGYESTKGSDWLDGSQLTVYNGTVLSDMGGSTVIQHSQDGTGSFTVDLGAAFEVSFVGLGYKYNSKGVQTFTLDQIPREAKVTAASEFTDISGSNITYQNPAGSLASISIALSTDGENPIGAYRSLPSDGSSYLYAVSPTELPVLRQLETTGSLSVYFLMKTVMGSDTFYDAFETTFRLADIEANRPAAAITISLDNSNIPNTYRSNFRHKYVQNISKAEVAVIGGAKYGASIMSLSSTINGETHSESMYTTQELTITGTVTATATAIDSRGLKGTASDSIEVIPYTSPYLSNEDVYRCDALGQPDNSGEHLKIVATKNYASVDNVNHALIEYRTKRADEAWSTQAWTTILARDSATNTYAGVISGTFAKTVAYTMQIRCVDDAGNIYTLEEDIPTEHVNLHLKKNKRGVGVGKYVENDDSFEVAYDSLFEGDAEVQGDATFGGDVSVTGDLDITTLTQGSITAITNAVKAAILNEVYPIGAIYISVDSTSPATLFGGTWQAITDKFLVGAGTIYPAGTTGGVDEIILQPENYQKDTWLYYGTGDPDPVYPSSLRIGYGQNYYGFLSENENDAFDNAPPYLSVYIWKRTA